LLRLLLGSLELQLEGFEGLVNGLLCLLQLPGAHVNGTHIHEVHNAALYRVRLSKTICEVVYLET
jgi:hypothetical protein